MMRQYELVERVRGYDPGVDEVALNKAYVSSMQAHGSQKRASGDPYFSHPVEVAGILSEKKLDTASIVTALLHDTVEDTVATLPDIEGRFGEEIGRPAGFGVGFVSAIIILYMSEIAPKKVRGAIVSGM